jgi:hypothetical protein
MFHVENPFGKGITANSIKRLIESVFGGTGQKMLVYRINYI